MLLLLIASKLTAFSQTGIDTTESVKCFPITTVRQIIKDLIIGDSAKTELTFANTQLTLTREQLIRKDSTITKFIDKEADYKKALDFERQKYFALEDYTKRVESNYETVTKQLKTAKFVSKVKSYVIVAGILTGVAAYFKFR